MGELGTNPTWNPHYGKLYVKTDGLLYFTDAATGAEYNLTDGDGSANGDNGTATGQMNFWDGSKWTYTETSEMVWDDTNKRLGVGVAAPSHKLQVINPGTSVEQVAVSGAATGTGAITNYGGVFNALGDNGIGVVGYTDGTGMAYGGMFRSMGSGNTGAGVLGTNLSTSGVNYGGYFTNVSSSGIGVYGSASGTGTAYGGYFSASGSGNTGAAVYGSNSSTTGYAGYFAGRVYSSSKFLTYASDSSANPGYSWSGDEDTGLYRYTTDVISVSTGGTENLRIGGNQMGMYASDTVSAPGYTWIGDTNMGMYRSGTDTIGFATAGVNRMTIGSASTGQVLISTSSGYGLSVDQSVNNIANTQASLKLDRSGGSSTTSAYYLIDFHRAGASQGSVTVTNATVAYNAFTGAHYAWTSEKISRGMLVDLVSDHKLYNENPESEVIYGVNMTTNANSKNVLGAYLSKGEYNFDDKIIKTPDLIMSVGNGDMWVADNGSNLEIGDYLISSDVPGHAMKVTDEYPTAYVVARVAENVDWSKVEEKTENGIKHKKISVFFESFILNQNLGLAFDKNQNLDDLSWFYAMDATTPVEKALQNQKQQLDALQTKVEMLEKNDNAELMEYIKQLEDRIEALESQKDEPVKTSFWSKLW